MTGTGTEHNVYGHELSDADLAAGRHREAAGGLWEELGRLQLEFLVSQGLQPSHRLLDVGCGCLRAGLHFVRYLEPGHYYGVDANASLVRAGYELELHALGLQQRLPRENLLVTGAFEAERFGVLFDFALAQSLFTHLEASQIRACLAAVARCMRPRGRLYATFFEAPAGDLRSQIQHVPGGIVSYANRDPFHYRLADIVGLARGESWEPHYLGEWKHPRAQRMLCFERR